MGDSGNLCTIYTLLTVPLDTLTITYSGTSDAWTLSNAYKNQIIQFQEMYDHCNSQTAWSDCDIFDLTSFHFDSYCFSISHNHDSLPHVIESLWSHQSVPMMGRSQELSLVLNTFLRNHTIFMMRHLMHPLILTWHTFMVMVVYQTMMCPSPQTQKT
jgi:hypothetical protein